MRTHPVNCMEEMVENYYNQISKDLGVCTCETCTKDILSFALNQLSAKYVTSEEGKEYVKTSYYDPQFESKVLSAIKKAAAAVGKNPRHE